MSSNDLSFEEKQTIVQDNLISVINDSVSSPIIRFLNPEERTLTEQEMEILFHIYNGYVYITHYSKKSRQTKFEVSIGKYFRNTIITLDLEPSVLSNLKAWIRSASKALEKYFQNRYENVFIGRLRFDFLTKDCKSFIIPNFRLETNIYLYRNLVEANNSHYKDETEYDKSRISYKDFVNDEWSDILAERDFRSHRT